MLRFSGNLPTGLPGGQFAPPDKVLDARTIGHNPQRLSLLQDGIVCANQVRGISNVVTLRARSFPAAPALTPYHAGGGFPLASTQVLALLAVAT